MSMVDTAIISCLILLIPKFVEKHLANFAFRRKLRMAVMFGGAMWIIFSCMHQLIYPFIGITDADANTLERFWYGSIVDTIESGNYELLFQKLMTPGRWFYVSLQGIFYYFTGGTVISMLAFNGFMGFWGGLTLTRTIYRLCPDSSSTGTALPLFLIFTPSVVFWSSANLKEALMYWAICQAFAFIVPYKLAGRMGGNVVLFVIGTLVGLLLRPHIMLFWIGSIVLIKIFETGFWKHGIVLLLLSPLVFSLGSSKLNLKSVKVNIQAAQRNMVAIIERGKDRSFTNSTFAYGAGGPVAVLSGAVNILFRPFLWRARNLRSALSAIEIWMLGVSTFVFWFRMTKNEWRGVLLNPGVQVAVLVTIPFFFLFAYFPNEGLIVRQRVQVFPALLVLLATPILQRRALGAESRERSAERG